ncbi:hypothetical protein VTK73DRAFT_5280 [Phialemonium thermophilum]|uniref:Uncharacterized protein n=1 Tax=Phialemonium thermophilum TaxID=223376 RepID=A0ABR3WP29_9PEZI
MRPGVSTSENLNSQQLAGPFGSQRKIIKVGLACPQAPQHVTQNDKDSLRGQSRGLLYERPSARLHLLDLILRVAEELYKIVILASTCPGRERVCSQPRGKEPSFAFRILKVLQVESFFNSVYV